MFSIVLCGSISVAMFAVMFAWMVVGPASPVAGLPGLMGVGFLYLTAQAIDERARRNH